MADLIMPFDPWGDPYCTCPYKFGFNPYTGCSHGCLYCYVSSYVPNFSQCRPKKDIIRRLARDLRGFKGLVSMANSSDPYPPMEGKLGITRKCLELLSLEDIQLQIITKSNLVTRDIDLLVRLKAMVSMTITTLDEKLASRLEPGAPLPKKRLESIRRLGSAGIPVSVRIDPIIPGINDTGLRSLVQEIAGAGALHVTSSTYKARLDSWKRLRSVFPETMDRLRPLYFRKENRHMNAYYLPLDIRYALLRKILELCDDYGLSFGVCREGFGLGMGCDGTHLLRRC